MAEDKSLQPDSDAVVPRIRLGEVGYNGLLHSNKQILEEANRLFRYPQFTKVVNEIDPKLLFIPKSFRFIPTNVFDNPYLLPPKNNSYLANLLAQPRVNQLKYLHGSWTAKAEGKVS